MQLYMSRSQENMVIFHLKIHRAESVIVGKQLYLVGAGVESGVVVPVYFDAGNLFAFVFDIFLCGCLQRGPFKRERYPVALKQVAFGRCDAQVYGLTPYRGGIVLGNGKCDHELLGFGDVALFFDHWL